MMSQRCQLANDKESFTQHFQEVIEAEVTGPEAESAIGPEKWFTVVKRKNKRHPINTISQVRKSEALLSTQIKRRRLPKNQGVLLPPPKKVEIVRNI